MRNADFLAFVVLGACSLPLSAQAQVVQNCQPGDYLDRTGATADRQLTWDFSIASDPERCMQVQVGQTVVWNGDLNNHPLGAQGGDSPNPIGAQVNGSVTFNAPGTFGFVCLSHSTMKGAIKVVPAAQPAPAVPAWFLLTASAALLAGGAAALRGRQRVAGSR